MGKTKKAEIVVEKKRYIEYNMFRPMELMDCRRSFVVLVFADSIISTSILGGVK